MGKKICNIKISVFLNKIVTEKTGCNNMKKNLINICII